MKGELHVNNKIMFCLFFKNAVASLNATINSFKIKSSF